MSQAEQTANQRSQLEQVRRWYERAEIGRAEARNDLVRYGQVREKTRRNLEAAAVTFADRLFNFHDAGSLKQPWDERGVDWLREATNRMVRVEEATSRRNHNRRSTRRPFIQTVDTERLLDSLQELFRIYAELGFDVEPNEGGRFHTDWGEDDSLQTDAPDGVEVPDDGV
jgi:hypothetical protein